MDVTLIMINHDGISINPMMDIKKWFTHDEPSPLAAEPNPRRERSERQRAAQLCKAQEEAWPATGRSGLPPLISLEHYYIIHRGANIII